MFGVLDMLDVSLLFYAVQCVAYILQKLRFPLLNTLRARRLLSVGGLQVGCSHIA